MGIGCDVAGGIRRGGGELWAGGGGRRNYERERGRERARGCAFEALIQNKTFALNVFTSCLVRSVVIRACSKLAAECIDCWCLGGANREKNTRTAPAKLVYIHSFFHISQKAPAGVRTSVAYYNAGLPSCYGVCADPIGTIRSPPYKNEMAKSSIPTYHGVPKGPHNGPGNFPDPASTLRAVNPQTLILLHDVVVKQVVKRILMAGPTAESELNIESTVIHWNRRIGLRTWPPSERAEHNIH